MHEKYRLIKNSSGALKSNSLQVIKKITEAATSVAILKLNFKMIRLMTDFHLLCLKSIEFHVLVVLKEFSFNINNSKV